MSQLVELAPRMDELKALAQVYVVNVDSPQNSRVLKQRTDTRVPVLLDNDLRVSRRYDMHARPGVPMGGMAGVPAMGFVVINDEGIVRLQRSHLYFGRDADLIINTLKSL